jgi:hypothetical protein
LALADVLIRVRADDTAGKGAHGSNACAESVDYKRRGLE